MTEMVIICLFITAVHVTLNWLVLNRPERVKRMLLGLPKWLVTALLGPEVAMMVPTRVSSPTKTTLTAIGAGSLIAHDLIAVGVISFNGARELVSRTNFGKRWAIKEALKGFCEPAKKGGKTMREKVVGFIIATGLILPRIKGAAVRTGEFVKEGYKHVIPSIKAAMSGSWEYQYRGWKVLVFPVLNGAAVPLGIMLGDINAILQKMGIDSPSMEDTAKEGSVIVVDPLIWEGYLNDQRWAKAILDHEVGHLEEMEKGGLGKATLYGRMLPNKGIEWASILIQEALATKNALKEDDNVVARGVLGGAYITYLLGALRALRERRTR